MKTRIFLLCLTVSMGACSNKFESIPDDELADAKHECTVVTDQSPGMAIRCDNIERECQRRRDAGRFVC